MCCGVILALPLVFRKFSEVVLQQHYHRASWEPAGCTMAWNDVDQSVQAKCTSPPCLCGNQSLSNWAVPAKTAFSSILDEDFLSAAGLQVGAVGWVMGFHSAAPSLAYRPNRRPWCPLGVSERRKEKEKSNRGGDRMLSITGAQTDLMSQGFQCSVVCLCTYRWEN